MSTSFSTTPRIRARTEPRSWTRPLGGVAARAAVAEHQDHALQPGRQDHGVADAVERRGVEDDVGEPLAEELERLGEPRRGQQLGRVEGDPARRDHVEVRDLRGLQDGGQLGLAREEGRQPRRLRHLEELVEVRAPHVAVDQEHLAGSQLAERDGEVGRHGRLAVLGLERGDHERLRRAVRRRVEEARPEVPEHLAQDRFRLRVGHQRERRVAVPVRLAPAGGGGAPAGRRASPGRGPARSSGRRGSPRSPGRP